MTKRKKKTRLLESSVGIRSVAVIIALTLFIFASPVQKKGYASGANEAPIYSAEQPGYFQVSGENILDPDQNPYIIKGISFANFEDEIPYNYANEDSYKELSQMGFNCIRFYLNYKFFEDDDAPFVYKEEAFTWIDQHLAWAEKYGFTILFNMHYPQGGYQSNGEGGALWKNENKEQARLVALWKEIASRYADRPSVMGYGLLNEPVVLWDENEEQTLKAWLSFAQSMIDEIRKVDQNHIIFVENVHCAVNPDGSNVHELNADQNFVKVNDNNVAYEFHFYTPFQYFTFMYPEERDVFNPIWRYPNEDLLITWDYSTAVYNLLESTTAHPVGDESSGWQLWESDLITIPDSGINQLHVALYVRNPGKYGKAYFDDVRVSMYDSNGNFVRDIVLFDFNQTEVWDNVFSYPASVSATSSYTEKGGIDRTGGLLITGGGEFAIVADSEPIRIFAYAGYSYKVSGWVKRESRNAGASAFATLKASYNVNSGSFTKETITKAFASIKEIEGKFNAPVFLGEFGINHGALEGRGGEEWLGDIIQICHEMNIGFNYHHYHGYAFALYRNSHLDLPDPAWRSEPIANVFWGNLATEDR